MSEWITDRPPTEEDAGPARLVWTTYNGKTFPWSYDGVEEGTPWMRMIVPEPYVKPKRYAVVATNDSETSFNVQDRKRISNVSYFIPTREAAERIAAIYEEVMP